MNHFGATVEVAVDYQLGEYKRVLRDFIPMHLAETGEKPNRLLPWNWPVVEAAFLSIVVPLVFLVKKARVGPCVFTFIEAGLTRASKSGAGSRAWTEVQAVRHLSGAFLIQLKAGGAMPVPYRSFTPAQRLVFESLVQRGTAHREQTLDTNPSSSSSKPESET